MILNEKKAEYQLVWVLIRYDQCPYKKGKFGHRYVHRTPCEHQGRDQGDISKSQEMPKIVCKPLEARERPE